MNQHERMNLWWKRAKAAESAVQRVRDLHAPGPIWEDEEERTIVGHYCRACGSWCKPTPYPCPTIRALDGEQG